VSDVEVLRRLNTTIPVSEDTLRRLWYLKRKLKKKNYDALIQYLIEKCGEECS
jgi:predicted nucleic acid-binding protein